MQRDVMTYRGLRQLLEMFEEMGELKTIRGADWNLEIRALTNLARDKKITGALLFDEIKDYPSGYRVLTKLLSSIKREALVLGIEPDDSKPIELLRRYKERIREIRPIPPRKVKSGPVMENFHTGKDINVYEFPAPKWNELDGGRYIGTACSVITRDPDEGWVNLGTYRVMIHDETTLGSYISPGKHGWIHRQKCFDRGEPCKVAISFGHDPVLFMVSSHEFPYGISEYDLAGGLKGEPLEVIEGPYTGLPILADAEIVMEGDIVPGEDRLEGPYGEWTGYYGGGVRPEPIIKVKTVMHRNDPILLGPSRALDLKAALIWDQMEKAGIPEIQGVWHLEAGTAYSWMWTVVSIKQRYPGHAKQAGLVASGCHAGANVGRYVIVVDEDIDITNSREVLWALATRSDPEKSIDIIRNCWSEPLDPRIPPEIKKKGPSAMFNTRAIIDACKPFDWIEEFPIPVRMSEDLKERMMAKWEKILSG